MRVGMDLTDITASPMAAMIMAMARGWVARGSLVMVMMIATHAVSPWVVMIMVVMVVSVMMVGGCVLSPRMVMVPVTTLVMATACWRVCRLMLLLLLETVGFIISGKKKHVK